MTIEAGIPVATRRSSDLSKHFAVVFAEAEDHVAAQLITVTLDDRGSLAERMSKAFPRMLALSPADRESWAQDLVDAARASFSTDRSHLAIAELTSWSETATAVAAGLSSGSAGLEWLDDDETVERPWPWRPPGRASWFPALRGGSSPRSASPQPMRRRDGATSSRRSETP